jgi:formamidopyrimidine-DNA glycosylase
MPELPEVETVRRGLALTLPGRVIERVEVLRKESVACPKPAQFSRVLLGHSFLAVDRRGKYLLFRLSEGAGLACHLRMSGRLLLLSTPRADSQFLRIRIVLNDGLELRFEDMRVFGRLWYTSAAQSFDQIIPALAKLGPEPLDKLDGRLLVGLLRNKSQVIKSTLLDQNVVAGIGNIYADESLFKAGIHPKTKAGAITLPKAKRLAQSIQSVLHSAIEAGGSTVRDYTNSEGVNGNYQQRAYVYGRAGQLCRVCSMAIERIKIGGRSSHFCPGCQT